MYVLNVSIVEEFMFDLEYLRTADSFFFCVCVCVLSPGCSIVCREKHTVDEIENTRIKMMEYLDI